MITQEELQDMLEHNPETGLWKWKVANTGRMKEGWFLGAPETSGYRRIKIRGKPYKAHRLAWLYIYGEWPPGDIDHLNGNKADNRITNLRVVDRSTNIFSVGMKSNNITGVTGISYYNGRKKPWCAKIKRESYEVIKYFETKEEAVEWRRIAELTVFHELSLKSTKGT